MNHPGASMRLNDHGRAVCTARRAFCERCGVAPLCPTAPEAYRQPKPAVPFAVPVAG